MAADLMIKNGNVLDSECEKAEKKDIVLDNGKIIKVGTNLKYDAKQVIDAEGCIVSPGLVDYHLHLFKGASDHGIIPDSALLPNGVTTAVDAGTSGVSTYHAFRRLTAENTQLRTKALLNISPIGMLNDMQHENLDPKYFDEKRMRELFETYPDDLVGIKLRMSLDVNPEMKEETLYKTIEIAETLGKRLIVHVTNPAMDIEKMALALRAGDVFCHMFQGKNQSIIDENGKIRNGIIQAREKGVLFDACNGRSNFDTDVAKKAMQQGFIPDIISTDMTTSTLYIQPVISLPFVMSKYLALGMSLPDVIRKSSLFPAKLLGLDRQIGRIEEGFIGDIAIFKLKKKKVEFVDYLGKKMVGSEVLVPQATIKDGIIVYRQTDF